MKLDSEPTSIVLWHRNGLAYDEPNGEVVAEIYKNGVLAQTDDKMEHLVIVMYKN